MLYHKVKFRNDIEIRIPLYDDEIFATCPDCGKEVQIDTESLEEILNHGDLSSTTVCCAECSKRREAVAMLSKEKEWTVEEILKREG